jgi:hypothetical protein
MTAIFVPPGDGEADAGGVVVAWAAGLASPVADCNDLRMVMSFLRLGLVGTAVVAVIR